MKRILRSKVATPTTEAGEGTAAAAAAAASNEKKKKARKNVTQGTLTNMPTPTEAGEGTAAVAAANEEEMEQRRKVSVRAKLLPLSQR
mmetsp:Transcript_35561/g.65061  ORF Transcript_35561/g.65061 Transcript_35561/m.65061 type:complete len:88 (+) Transcript_35561:284-547(+)